MRVAPPPCSNRPVTFRDRAIHNHTLSRSGHDDVPAETSTFTPASASRGLLLAAVETATHVVLADKRTKFQPIPPRAGRPGHHQRKLNNNFNSWMDDLSDQTSAKANCVPHRHDWVTTWATCTASTPTRSSVHVQDVTATRLVRQPRRCSQRREQSPRNPSAIVKPGGISGTDNLKQSLRVMGAEDHPDAIHAAFLGTKNVGGRPVPRPQGSAQDTRFWQALRDPRPAARSTTPSSLPWRTRG